MQHPGIASWRQHRSVGSLRYDSWLLLFHFFLACLFYDPTNLLSSSSLMGFFRPYMLCFYRNDWEADPWFHYCVCQHICWDIRSRTLNQLGIINIPSRFRGQDGIFLDIIMLIIYIHIYVYLHCIYTFRIFRFVSFAELGCRLQRLRVEVVVQNLGNVWNAGESVEVPHQTFSTFFHCVSFRIPEMCEVTPSRTPLKKNR